MKAEQVKEKFEGYRQDYNATFAWQCRMLHGCATKSDKLAKTMYNEDRTLVVYIFTDFSYLVCNLKTYENRTGSLIESWE